MITYILLNNTIMSKVIFKITLTFSLFIIFANSFCFASPRQVLKGEATGKVLLNDEPWGSAKVTFNNVGGDASFVVICEKNISAGANSATCTGTNVDGFFSG